jgi:heme A synthase
VDFGPHRALGYVTFVLPLLVAVGAATARRPRRARRQILLPVAIAVLVSIQVLIAKIAENMDDTAGHYVVGLHGLLGMLVLALIGAVAADAFRPQRSDS